MTSQSLQQFIAEPMNVPKWPSLNQGVERVVKSVTEMSCKYYSHGQRDGAIRLQQASRLAYGIESKQDLIQIQIVFITVLDMVRAFHCETRGHTEEMKQRRE